MSDEKKDNVNHESSQEMNGEQNQSTKDTPNTPSVSDLIKEKENLISQIENLKGTQSAQSKTLNEYKAKLEEFSKTGITPEAVNEFKNRIESLEKETQRKNLLVDIASTKNIPSKALKFIKGNTKEEIESSIDEFISISNIGEKKPIPKDFSKSEEKKTDTKEEASKFIKRIQLIK